MSGAILVVGATGEVGGHLLDALERRNERVWAATRDPARAADALRTAAVPVRFDLDQPETFAGALEEVDRVFLIARPGDESSDRTAIPFLDAVKAARVRHVVNLSAMGAEQRGESFALRRTELYLESLGVAYTHLRPNWFMQVLSGGALAGAIKAGRLALPAGDAAISYIDARDVAAVAAVTLTETGHYGKSYTLTGPEALDHATIAETITAAGHAVRYEAIDEEATRIMLGGAGFPPPWIDRLIGFYRLVRAGACAPVSPDVERVLRRPARTFAKFLEVYGDSWD